jgi:hypothetical protein
MRNLRNLIPALVLALASVPSWAAFSTYTNSADFLAQVAPGFYTESFDGLNAVPPAGPVNFAGGGFGYSASAPSDIYLGANLLGASGQDEDLTIVFTSGNIKAFGGNFFATDFNDSFQEILVSLLLGDGSRVEFMPTSATDSYLGYVSDVAIASVTFTAPGASLYAGVDNLTVGTTPRSNDVPEPTSLALVALAAAGLVASRRRAA